LEYFLISSYFKEIIKGVSLKRKITNSKYVISFLLVVLNYVSWKFDYNQYLTFLLLAISIDVLSMIYLYQLITLDLDISLNQNPNFFIVCGFLVFYISSFFVMGLVNYIYKQNPVLARQVFSINHILNIIFYSLIAYGFYIQWKSTKSSLSS
jgi:general stress protein CsbA